MDSLVLILKYIFSSKDVDVDFDSIESFFENGTSFPKFISLIFDVDEIPGIDESEEAEFNNDIALQYLFKNNKSIAKIQPNYDSTEDKTNLLKLILTKQYYTLDHQEVIDKCNSLVQSLGVHYDSEKDLLKLQSLITILHVLTDGDIENDSVDEKDIESLLPKIFAKAKVPLVINSKSIKKKNQYQFYIQLDIIFNILSDKTNLDLEESQSSQKIEKYDSLGIPLSSVSKKKRKSRFFNFFRRKSDLSDESSDSSEYYSDDDDEKDNEDLQNEALLMTINAIGSRYKLSFENFESAVKDDNIPRFVMSFFDLDTIENVEVKDTPKSRTGSERLTESQLKNIEGVIEFLKKKKEKFKILMFDFEDIKNVESSTILFYTNFLNCFFIKKLKQEMYTKTVELLCTHTSRFNEKYDSLLFAKYRIYPCLLHFITTGNVHFEFNYHKEKFNDKKAEPYFEKANIPMIINKRLMQFAKKYVSFPIFYQLQFIFDALDKAPPSRAIVQVIMKSLFKMKNIKVPKYNEIASSILVKRRSLKFQDVMGDKYRNKADLDENDYFEEKSKKTVMKAKTFLEICKENNILMSELKNSMQPSKSGNQKKPSNKTFDEFWNKCDSNYKNDNGVIYNKEESHKNKKKSQTDWINEITEIQKNIKKRDRKTLVQSKDNENVRQSLMFNRRKSGFEPKLYKLFNFDENESKWNFLSTNFDQFSDDKRIKVDTSKTPLILFFNSYENELVSISSNLINSLYPNLEKDNPDEIFVYALCDRSLTMLNYVVDFNNAEKASIKPIFLMLHIPKSKEKHPKIRLIVIQIYAFLSTICDFEVTVLNKTRYLDQIEFVKNILELNKIHDTSNQKTKKKNKKKKKDKTKNEEEKENENDKKDFLIPPFSFSYQPPSSSNLDSNVSSSGENENGSGENENDSGEKSSDSLFAYKDPKFIFLVNDSTVQFNSQVEENLNNNEFFKNLLSQINKETYLHYINVEDSDTYECFLNTMNDLIMAKCCTYLEVKNNLKSVTNFNFTEAYIKMVIKGDYSESLEKLVYKRMAMLKSNDEQLYEKNFSEEITKAFPKKNQEIILNCMRYKNSFVHDKVCNEKARNVLKDKLKLCSNSHLSFISDSIQTKYFWKYQQMADMINAHKKYLKDEFLSIIMNLFDDELVESAFEFNFDIVENQLKKDQQSIMEIMQPFIDKITIKNMTKVFDLRNTAKEGTNYAMKETENLREIKIAVQINKDLKSEIPQDF